MKKCELCKFLATTYCESDEASLCWNCDAKVHGANFLVARHSRSLLCGTCQSLTPWKASGVKLGRPVSVCERCANGANNEEEDSHGALEDDIEADVCDLDDDGDGDDGEGDNQVVPWSSSSPPPAASSSSSSSSGDEESASRFGHSDGEFSEPPNTFSLKRTRKSSTDLHSLLQDDTRRSASRRTHGHAALTAQADCDGEASSVDYSSRPLKCRRIEPDRQVLSGSSSAEIIYRLNNGKLNEGSEAP